MEKIRETIRRGSIKFFIMLCLLCCCLFDGQAQDGTDYRKMPVSLQVRNENLGQVLDKIAGLAKVQFFYNHSILNLQKKVTLDLKDCPLDNLLLRVLGGENVELEYQLNRTVVIKPMSRVHQGNDVIKVSGIIVDAKSKEPLPGASIVLAEQRAMGVVTDIGGKFFIEVPHGISALVISFIGYETETFPLADKDKYTDLVIKLTPKVAELEGVVVTGMTPRKVEGFSGSYVTVKGEELKKLSPNNLLKALQFFDPSFQIIENNQRGSDPNAMPEFRMRGDVQIGGISGSNWDMLLGDYSNRPNMPLFILDGFEVALQRIVDLDVERVELVTILKDASATAIYGSRAANGVVVFETKKPPVGALNISYAVNLGLSVPDLRDYNLMDAEEKLQYEWDAGLYSPNSAEQMNDYNHYKSEILKGVNTYWLSAPLRTALTHSHSLSMGGGDEALRYNLGLNYNSSPGVMKESDRTSMGLNLSIQYRRKKWNISNQLSLMETKGNNTSYGSFSEYTKLNPYYRKTDENGQYTKVLDRKFMGVGTGSITITNPLYNTQFPHKDLSQNFSVTDNFSIECAILENLRVSAQASFTKGTAKSEVFKSKNHTDFADQKDLTKQGSYSKNQATSFGWTVNASVNYNLTMDKHLVSLFARYDIRESQSDGITLSATGFPNDNMTDLLFAYNMDQRVRGNENTTRSIGVTGGASYMYDYRYALDLSIRGDMASQFGSGTGMAPFWSVGVRWNADREKWLQHSFVSALVLRGSYGVTGSQNYSPYQAIETYSFNDLLFPYLSSDVLGAELRGFGNSDLGWSKTYNRSLILEFGLWENRLNASINYYSNLTDNLLLEYTLSPSSGFPSMTMNAGSALNTGYDISVNLMPVRDYERQIQWTIGWNASHNRNRIKKISNVVKKMNEENLKKKGAPLPIYEEGKSTTQLFAVPSLGIDPATGQEVFLKRNGQKTYVWDPADKVSFGDTEPKLRGAVNSSLTWKNLSLGLACSYQFGGYRYNSTLVDKVENASVGYNVDKRAAEDRWREVGDVTKFKSIKILGQQTATSSRFIEKFNEFRFASLNVGYRLEAKKSGFLRACNISSVSMGTTFQDLIRLSSVKEERGLDYPFARMFNLSLSVLFN